MGSSPAPALSPNLRANGETHLSPRVLTREAAKIVAELDLSLTPVHIRLLIDLYLIGGHRTTPDFREWLSYADPTGERACRNVMRRSRNGQRRQPRDR